MKIGYACLTVGVPDTQMRTCRKANATSENLMELIEQNLHSTEKMIDYNIKNDIKMYRISSDLIPFGSDKETNNLDWATLFKDSFNRMGQKIKDHDIRVSLHPGQYTVLNSPNEEVISRAIDDLEYQDLILNALNVDDSHKLIIHIGGVYGDKEAAKARFIETYERLSKEVKARLIIENDDRLYTIADVLEISEATGAPVVYDNLHNFCNPSDPEKSDAYWIAIAKKTWKKQDGPPKVHYSQQRPNARLGAHTETIYIDPFMSFYEEVAPLNVDIMLEVKDKNLSAVKANLATNPEGTMKDLEKEWARYKYAVLSHSQKHYQEIREVLKDKSTYPVVPFYRLIEEALDTPPAQSAQLNGLEHVRGHLKKHVTEKEKTRFLKMKEQWLAEDITLSRLKKWMKRIALKYNETYLLQSLYFDME